MALPLLVPDRRLCTEFARLLGGGGSRAQQTCEETMGIEPEEGGESTMGGNSNATEMIDSNSETLSAVFMALFSFIA